MGRAGYGVWRRCENGTGRGTVGEDGIGRHGMGRHGMGRHPLLASRESKVVAVVRNGDEHIHHDDRHGHRVDGESDTPPRRLKPVKRLQVDDEQQHSAVAEERAVGWEWVVWGCAWNGDGVRIGMGMG